MKRWFKFLAITTTLTILLTGCYPTGEKNISSTEGSGDTQLFVRAVSEKVGDVNFNYEILPDLPTQLPKIKLKSKLDEELVKKVLLRDKTIAPNADRPDWLIETTDGSLLAFDFGFSFTDGRVDDSRSNFVTIPGSFDEFCNSNGDQLEAFSSRDAVERVNKLLDDLGIENYGEPYIIPVSPEKGNDMLKKHGIVTTNKDQSRDDYDLWTDDDGIYILKYRLKFNGTDVCSGDLKTLGTARTIPGAEITAYVNKDLIFYLDVTSLYEAISLNEETVDLKFDAGYASDALIEHYSKISSVKYPTFFTECKLEYIPVEIADNNEIIFAPAWCFAGYQLKGVNYNKPEDFAEYYYADTGVRYGSY